MNIKILTFQKKHGRRKGTIGSSIIRGDWLVNNWNEASLWTEGCSADAIIFQKVYWEKYIELYQGIKILDLCDPEWMKGEMELVKLSKIVNAITCSSKGIYDFVSKIIKDIPVIHIPDRVDLKVLPRIKKHQGKAKTVVWYGYHGNAKEVLPDVMTTLKQFDLKLLVISNNDYNPYQTHGVEIENRKFDWESFPYDLCVGDIVINPQPAFGKFKYKSENKTINAWALGMPVAKTLDDMERLLDPDERIKETDKNYQEVLKKWNVKYSIQQFQELIKKL